MKTPCSRHWLPPDPNQWPLTAQEGRQERLPVHEPTQGLGTSPLTRGPTTADIAPGAVSPDLVHDGRRLLQAAHSLALLFAGSCDDGDGLRLVRPPDVLHGVHGLSSPHVQDRQLLARFFHRVRGAGCRSAVRDTGRYCGAEEADPDHRADRGGDVRGEGLGEVADADVHPPDRPGVLRGGGLRRLPDLHRRDIRATDPREHLQPLPDPLVRRRSLRLLRRSLRQLPDVRLDLPRPALALHLHLPVHAGVALLPPDEGPQGGGDASPLLAQGQRLRLRGVQADREHHREGVPRQRLVDGTVQHEEGPEGFHHRAGLLPDQVHERDVRPHHLHLADLRRVRGPVPGPQRDDHRGRGPPHRGHLLLVDDVGRHRPPTNAHLLLARLLGLPGRHRGLLLLRVRDLLRRERLRLGPLRLHDGLHRGGQRRAGAAHADHPGRVLLLPDEGCRRRSHAHRGLCGCLLVHQAVPTGPGHSGGLPQLLDLRGGLPRRGRLHGLLPAGDRGQEPRRDTVRHEPERQRGNYISVNCLCYIVYMYSGHIT